MRVEHYQSILNTFQGTEAGRSLQNIFRWSTFRNGESDQLWSEALGATANDFTHGQLMYGIARSFLRHEPDRFTTEQQQTFLNGVICHDWGEAIINGNGVGDVSAQTKTDMVEKEESVIARLAINALNLPSATKLQLLTGYVDVVEGLDPQLHHAFKALEKSEYVITAMKLYQNCRRMNKNGKVGIDQEIPMIGRVLVIDLGKVLDLYAPTYLRSLGVLFYTAAPLIDEMFAYVHPWLLESKEWGGKPVDHATLAKNFSAKWSAFKAGFPFLAPKS